MSSTATSTQDDAFFPLEEPSLFDDDWKSCGAGDDLEGLGVIADFNAGFDFGGGEHVDPQVLSLPSTANGVSATMFSKAVEKVEEGDQSVGADEAFWSELVGDVEAFDTLHGGRVGGETDVMMHDEPLRGRKGPNYPLSGMVDYHRTPAYHRQITSAPDFYPSIEIPSPNTSGHQYYHQQLQPILFPNHNAHHLFSRRSVSEPPTGPSPDNIAHIHYRPPPGYAIPPQPEVTFHRPGHFIGTREPSSDGTTQSRRTPKRRNHASAKRMGSQPAHARQRPEIKRTRTQPARGVTSAPASPSRDTAAAREKSALSRSSRAGTPVSVTDLESVGSSLFEPDEGVSRDESSKEGGFWISMSAEKLQGLIAEAVREALVESKSDASVLMSDDVGGRIEDDGGEKDEEGCD